MYIAFIFTFVQVGCIGVVGLYEIDTNLSKANKELLIIAVALKVIVDSYIYFILIRAFKFFHKLFKENNISEKPQEK